ncbi:MAG: hypothetical protein H8E59_11635 [Actinobacteria bacterium]|nr:hypothetical protein [Actinomycetota bacterium]
MNAYDPQARRARSRPAAVSPVDSLLGDDEVLDGALEASDPPVESAVGDGTVAGMPDGEVRPFEAPPIELTDEHADRLHRFGVLAAVAAVLLVLLARRKRRRSR